MMPTSPMIAMLQGHYDLCEGRLIAGGNGCIIHRRHPSHHNERAAIMADDGLVGRREDQ